MSLYQKYRSKTFQEILTQNHITTILQASLRKQSFGHAYLFVGTRGAGKTSLARIFARALNCEDKANLKKSGEPCNKCESCKLSLSGNHPDIIEMDAASNRGIDEIRSLKESVEFMPSMGSKKVYIIDEVHMMTKEAFNAILKTLEEPPLHVVFIMCTTEMHKIPSTIISRSQVFELKFASLEEIVKKIDVILKGEKKSIDQAGKEFIAKLGKGSFRDTESILEKVLKSNDNDELAFEDIVKSLGFSELTLVNEFKDLLYGKDLLNTQSLLQERLDEGSISNFNYQVSEIIYEDIVAELQKGVSDSFKIRLFEYLCGIDKEIRGSLSQKILYIAKILTFLSKETTTISDIPPKEVIAKVEKDIYKEIDEKPVFEEKNTRINPAALLRKKMQENKKTEQPAQETENDIKKSSPISKIDFLEFIKSKNTFLYRFFTHKDFEIRGGQIVVDCEKKMERDLLSKLSTQKIIEEFGSKYNANLRIEFAELKINKKTEEEKEVAKISKKVEDLSEEEIKNIFGTNKSE